MALFGSGKNDGKPPEGGAGGSGGTHEFSPDKASKFFKHAQAVHDTGNFEYAIQLWLSGLRFDPGSMSGLVSFFNSTASYLNDGASKKGISKDVVKAVSGKGDVDRFLTSLLEWGLRPTDPVMAVKALESVAKMRLNEPGRWIGDRAVGAVLRDKKVRKDLLLKCAESLSTIGAADKAIVAAEEAKKLDPTDGQLAAFIRELAAQATMNKGGYDQTGQSGGFRANIRDADKQRMLEDAERISKTDDVIERLLSDAEDQYIKRPGDVPSIEKYAKLLLERGRPADEEKAHKLYLEAFEQSKAFRWRELAGGIRMRQARRKTVELRKMLEQSPGNEMITRMLEQSTREGLELEAAEYRLQCEAYPTDLGRKFDLGKRLFQLDKHQDAIELFQDAQNDPRNRAAALSLLGQSFLKIGWNDEGIGALRTALENKDVIPEVNLELRYWLMIALQAKGEHDRDLEAAMEADKLASSIALQQIGYLDIRQRRDTIKKLVAELRTGKAG